MPKKIVIGPSWTEVILGAVFSFVLGVILAAMFLVLKPVLAVRELPKPADRVADAVYYLEGTRDGSKGRLAAAKRKSFAQGESVAVNEDEINLQIAPVKAAPAPPPKKKDAEGLPPMNAEATVTPPNFRIRDNAMQIAVPVQFSMFGLTDTVVVQAKGEFVRKGDAWVFDPATLTVGSCSLDRLPIVNSLVFGKFFGGQPVPEDIATPWKKLVGVHIEGDTMKLVMP